MSDRVLGNDDPVTESGANTGPGDNELVVLLDESGQPCGSAPKADVHHQHTPLHLAFSCWVTDIDGRILLTRRAWSKPTWPGVWTNAFCGHPQPHEPLPEAVRRRARDELGVAIAEPEPMLPNFRYRAVMANGTVENEICPVFITALLGDPAPDPGEVAEYQWLSVHDLHHHLDRDSQWLSPWATLQLTELADLVPALRCAGTSATEHKPALTSRTTYRDAGTPADVTVRPPRPLGAP